MNQRQIGIALMIFGILTAITTYLIWEKENFYIREHIAEQGSCYLTDGTCLHEDRNYSVYILGSAISLSLILLGVYLIFFDNTQKMLAEQHITIASALENAKKQDKEKDEFNAFLAGFDEKQQLVLKAIREQDGIQQSTLRFRTSTSKTALSQMLSSLEERGFIKRESFGKTNKVFLVKKF